MERRSAMVAVLIAMYFFSYYLPAFLRDHGPYLTQEFSIGANGSDSCQHLFLCFRLCQFPLGPPLIPSDRVWSFLP